MDQEITEAKLKEQVEAVFELQSIINYYRWEIITDGLTVYVTMYPQNASNKRYLARFTYDDYPQRAPTFTFIDSETKREGVEFWPKHGAFNSAVSRKPPQLCIAGIREFHEGLHKEFPWIPEKYPLGRVLESIQAELTKGHPSD